MQVHVIVLPNLGELFFEKQKKKNVLIKFILINLFPTKLYLENKV